MEILKTIGGYLLALLGFGILVFVHEMGHFIFAKLFKVRVEEFSIGFGPSILKFKKGETVYKLSSIPLGGYCKLAGEEIVEGKTPEPGEFYYLPPLKRAAILLAGPFFNFLLGVVFLMIINLTGITFVTYPPKVSVPKKIVLDSKTVDSPAYKAGLREGDIILAVNNKKVLTWADISKEINFTTKKPIEIKVKRKNKQMVFKFFPLVDPDTGVYIAGITFYSPLIVESTIKDFPAEKAGIKKGDLIVKVNNKSVKNLYELKYFLVKSNLNKVKLTIKRGKRLIVKNIKLKKINGLKLIGVVFHTETKKSLKKIKNPLKALIRAIEEGIDTVFRKIPRGIGGLITGKVKARKALGGPIKIVYFTEKVTRRGGITGFLSIMAYISLGLFLINLFPLPALDGSYIIVFLFEFITGIKPSPQFIKTFQYVGFSILIALMVLIIFNDIFFFTEKPSPGYESLKQLLSFYKSVVKMS